MIAFCNCLPPTIENPVAPHCQGAIRKVVPTGSEQMLIFAFFASGAQLPFYRKMLSSINDNKRQ